MQNEDNLSNSNVSSQHVDIQNFISNKIIDPSRDDEFDKNVILENLPFSGDDEEETSPIKYNFSIKLNLEEDSEENEHEIKLIKKHPENKELFPVPKREKKNEENKKLFLRKKTHREINEKKKISSGKNKKIDEINNVPMKIKNGNNRDDFIHYDSN